MPKLRLSDSQFDRLIHVLERVAAALEHRGYTAAGSAKPPARSGTEAPARPPVTRTEAEGLHIAPVAPGEPTFADTGEQFDARTQHDRDLALALGVAPWSPDFQAALNTMRAEILENPKMEQDEEGNWSRRQYTEEEADDVIRQAFQLAKAERNTRRSAGAQASGAVVNKEVRQQKQQNT